MFSIEKKLLCTHHCGNYQLAIQQSQDVFGQIDLILVTGKEHRMQSVFVRNNMVKQAAYSHKLSSLTTLHSDNTLVLSRLALQISDQIFEFKLLRKLSVCPGLNLWNKYLHGRQVVLMQDRSIDYGEHSVDQIELLLVDSVTGQRRSKILKMKIESKIIEFMQSFLVLNKKDTQIRVFEAKVQGLED